MTFVLEGPSALLFFLCWLALLCICLSGMQRTEEVGPCPRHPNTDQCAHRRKKGD